MYRVRSFIIIFSFVSIMLYLHNISSHHASGHHHGQIIIPHDQVIPTLDGNISQDRFGTWVIELDATNFTFAPEKVGTIEKDYYNEGHAHLYINGVKIDSLFGPIYRLGYLQEGIYDTKVSLNGHNHEVFIYNDQPIAFQETIQVSKSNN